MQVTLGHMKVRRALANRTQAEVADLVGCSQQAVSRISKAKLTPKTFALVRAFEVQLGIAPRDWETPARAKAARRAA